MVKCPVCGYDTLTKEGGYEICYICGWEDELLARKISPEEIPGGPNGDYSLSEARNNFKKYMTMYRPSDPIYLMDKTKEKDEAKKNIINALNKLSTCITNTERKNLEKEIDRNKKILLK